jgi:hypothetical protein
MGVPLDYASDFGQMKPQASVSGSSRDFPFLTIRSRAGSDALNRLADTVSITMVDDCFEMVIAAARNARCWIMPSYVQLKSRAPS